MPVLIALVGLAAAVAWYVIRARHAAQAAGDLFDMANDVRLAARRFGFRHRTNVHPVDSIERAELAIAATAMAFQDLDGLPTQDQRDALQLQLRKVLKLDAEEAQEAMALSRWLVAQCGGADPALSRISRKLYKISGVDALQPLLSVIRGAVLPGEALSTRQKEALADIQRAFKL